MLVSLAKQLFFIGKLESVVEYILEPLKKNQNSQVILPCSLHDLAVAQDNSNYEDIDINTTDSMWLTWWFKFKTGQKIERVYGPDLMKLSLEKSMLYFTQSKHHFLAADNQSKKRMEKWLASYFNTLKYEVSILNRKVSLKKERSILEKVINSNPQIIWLGVGSPKQLELASWLKTHSNKRNPIKIFCVGAAFNFVTGSKIQAPEWVQKSGLEWLFRLLTEPRRLWKRYLVVIPRYLLKLGVSLLRK